jgi:hypothetical protein
MPIVPRPFTIIFLGRNFYHGYYLSDGVDGDFTLFKNPRFDFPPGVNYEPWIPFHSDFAVEMARLSAFINSGDTPTNLAVLYPLRTYWAEGAQHSFAQESAFWNQWLVTRGINFDFVDEDQILEARISHGELKTEFRRYRGLILPGVSTLYSVDTLEKILTFADEDGIIIASGQLPKATQVSGLDAGLEKDFICCSWSMKTRSILPIRITQAKSTRRYPDCSTDIT